MTTLMSSAAAELWDAQSIFCETMSDKQFNALLTREITIEATKG